MYFFQYSFIILNKESKNTRKCIVLNFSETELHSKILEF